MSLQEELHVRRDGIRENETLVVEAEKQVSLLEHQRTAHVEERERRESAVARFSRPKLATLVTEKESLKAALEAKAQEIHQFEIETQTVRVAMASLQETIASVKEEYEQERSQLEDMRLEIAAFREKLIALERERQVTEDAIVEIDEKFSIAVEEAETTETKITSSTEQLQQLGRVDPLDGRGCSSSAPRP